MGLFSKKKKADGVVWRDSNGNIRCLGNNCPQKKCDDTCPIWKNTIAAELLKRGDTGNALRVMEETVAMVPDFYDAWNNMGAVYGQYGSYQKAYDCYLRAHTLRPDKFYPVFGLALTCRDLNRYEECLRWCDAYDELNDDHRCDEIRSTVSYNYLHGNPETTCGNVGEQATVRKDEASGISCLYVEARYKFDKEGEVVRTPGGNELTTEYRELADRLFDDLVAYGPDHMGSDSILPWHYTMIDNFAPRGKEAVIDILEDCFLSKPDWTFKPQNEVWRDIFGTEDSRKNEIRVWLSKCTTMQLTAACCIGNAYRSLNMAFAMAAILGGDSSNDRESAMIQFSSIVAKATEVLGFGSAYEVMQDFKTFELYYGIHLKENRSPHA